MQHDERSRFIARSLGAFQDTVRKSGPAASASYSLIGGLALFGGIGYALDAWLKSGPWCLVGGLGVGLVVGFYELARAVFHR